MAIVAGRCLRVMFAVLLIAASLRASEVLAPQCDQRVATLRAGQLIVSSQGCSLRQVLNAISHATGIETTMPGSASALPVFATLGPGQPARVLSDLLDGLPFNSRLIAKADGSGGLVGVALTERRAAVVLSADDLKKLAEQKKKDDAARLALASDDSRYDRTAQRPEVDAEMIKRLPALPPGVPSSMWALYPGIAQAVADTGSLPSFPETASSALPANGAGSGLSGPAFQVPNDPGAVPKGAIGLPQLPPGIDPNLGKLYPWNLMQLIQGGFKPSYPPVPPMAGAIPLTPPPTAGH